MSFIKYIVSPKGRKQVLQIVLVNIALLLLFWIILRWYTDHGEQIAVPDLSGLTLQEATQTLDDRGLTLLVVDSIYDEKATGGKVVEQSPIAESKVKEGRQVFVTIYRFQPPQETINIEEGDYAQVAIIKLKNKGIRFDIKEVPNGNMIGSVINITHKGRKIKQGETIARGEKVTLTVGVASNASIALPNLQGLSYQQAMSLLDSLQLMGQAFFDSEPLSAQDSSLFRVCRQDPPFETDGPGVPSGRIIDFWLSNAPCQTDSIP